MNAKRKGMTPQKSRRRLPAVTWHPALGSRLTLLDVMQDPVNDCPGVNDSEYASRKLRRSMLALENAAERARAEGDLALEAQVLMTLVDVALRACFFLHSKRKPASGRATLNQAALNAAPNRNDRAAEERPGQALRPETVPPSLLPYPEKA